MLSEEQIAAYQEIHRKFFGKDISRKDALEQGTKLMTFVEIVYRHANNTEGVIEDQCSSDDA